MKAPALSTLISAAVAGEAAAAERPISSANPTGFSMSVFPCFGVKPTRLRWLRRDHRFSAYRDVLPLTTSYLSHAKSALLRRNIIAFHLPGVPYFLPRTIHRHTPAKTKRTSNVCQHRPLPPRMEALQPKRQ